MRLSLRLAPAALVTALVLAGCSPVPPNASSESQRGPRVEDVGSLQGTRVNQFESLEAATAASDLVIVGEISERIGQLEEYPSSVTESRVEIGEILKGDPPGATLRIADIGNTQAEMEDAASPLIEGQTYVLFLHSLVEYESSVDGTLIDASNIYVSTIPGHYVRQGQGGEFALDVDLPDNIPSSVTLNDIRQSIEHD